jgi:hypothetical protein
VVETPTEWMYRHLPSCVAGGPPAGALPAEARQTVCRLGVPTARERSGDRLEHLSVYRHRCSSSREELRKDSSGPGLIRPHGLLRQRKAP